MERFEKIRRNYSEYPVIQKRDLKVESYPIRYNCTSSRILKIPIPLNHVNESKDNGCSSNEKILVDTATSTNVNSSEPPKVQLNSRSNKLATRKCRPRNTARYMTQPITLIEIKELEEDAIYNNSINADPAKE